MARVRLQRHRKKKLLGNGLRFEYRPGHYLSFVYRPRPLLFLHFVPANDTEGNVT